MPVRSRLPVPPDPAADGTLGDLPPGASPHLDRLRSMARVLDDLVAVPGTRWRVGLDPILGLLPGVGDAVTGSVAAYAIVVARRLGAPPSVLVRMAGNVVLDLVAGSVPLVGDLFDFGWKANRKNVRLVERYAVQPEAVKRSSGLLVGLLIAFLVGAVVAMGWAVVAVVRLLSTPLTFGG